MRTKDGQAALDPLGLRRAPLRVRRSREGDAIQLDDVGAAAASAAAVQSDASAAATSGAAGSAQRFEVRRSALRSSLDARRMPASPPLHSGEVAPPEKRFT